MLFPSTFDPLLNPKLVSLDEQFEQLINLYENKKFPKVLLLNGKKGLGKFTLINHFLNYLFTKNEKEKKYNITKKEINTNSKFYSSLLNQTSQEILFLKAEENKNIKIEDVRNLKQIISNTSLIDQPRFIIIDEVEYLNGNSANALLKILEEPSLNNFFILINNQQSDLLKTISSRCLAENIFMPHNKKKDVIDYLINLNQIKNIIIEDKSLTPGTFIKFNYICEKYEITNEQSLENKLNLLLNLYKKDKDKAFISLIYYFIDIHFLKMIKDRSMKTDYLLKRKSMIFENLDNLTKYNLNISSVLNDINFKLQNV
jgi:DNA polymerase III subunit delta'